jgi:hypothetical protein
MADQPPNAMLNYPAAVALDTTGNVYIADTINRRIRLVNASTGVIYTIAGNGGDSYSGDGGPALAAEINSPAGIAVDGSGRVHFSDEGNHCIRLLTPVAQPFSWCRQRPPYRFRPVPRH